MMAQSGKREPFSIEIGAQQYVMRSIGYRDTEELHQLDSLCFSTERAFTEGYFLLLFFYENAYGWALEDNGDLVAFILLTAQQKRINIATIDVHPDYRRRGIGAGLLEFAEEHSRSAEAASLILQVETTNTPAIRLYHRFGFEKERILSNYYVNADAWQMRKKLI